MADKRIAQAKQRKIELFDDLCFTLTLYQVLVKLNLFRIQPP